MSTPLAPTVPLQRADTPDAQYLWACVDRAAARADVASRSAAITQVVGLPHVAALATVLAQVDALPPEHVSPALRAALGPLAELRDGLTPLVAAVERARAPLPPKPPEGPDTDCY